MNQQEIEYALAKQVPDMARGCTISTSYGDIALGGEAGALLAMLLEQLFKQYLAEFNGCDGSKGGRDRHVDQPGSVDALVQAGCRANGKHLTSPERARAMLSLMQAGDTASCAPPATPGSRENRPPVQCCQYCQTAQQHLATAVQVLQQCQGVLPAERAAGLPAQQIRHWPNCRFGQSLGAMAQRLFQSLGQAARGPIRWLRGVGS